MGTIKFFLARCSSQKINATWLCASKSDKMKGKNQRELKSFTSKKEEKTGMYTTGS